MKLFWIRITHSLNQIFVSLGHFFSAKHYAATWILLVVIVAGFTYSFIKYRAFWDLYWRRVLIGLGIIVVVSSFWIIPKINYWYDTRLVIPKTLSEQEKKQYLDQWHNVLINTDQGKNHSSLYNDIGILRGSVKDYNGAVRAFKKAISKNPDDARFYRNLAITYTTMDKYSDAENAFKQAVKVSPTQPEYWLELGELYVYKIKDNEAARLFYLDAMSRTNSNVSVAQAFALYWENIKMDYPEAIKYWQIVLDGVDETQKTAFSKHIAELKLKVGNK